ncbi:predicted protein [Nematostella vectensis]|uniref:LIM and SH3 domain protein 1 n=2 Tax=Nematostella vectensis TaxID=45351 RepID=A7RI30_NEMVE|nr:predicted protein [Nematostella vectensis]|eukprot:XP_001641143.1 predicted protein [Nematostella vectensis]
MNPPCARCRKTVYPVEKLSCLDKVWHKGCFKCESCGMTLNMKTYKGYQKLPYCDAHYPKTKHTVVADTLENQRIKTNTQIQSQVQYQRDFEQSRGRYTVISDDPETLRAINVNRNSSNVAYQSGSRDQYTGSRDPRMPSYGDRPPMPRTRKEERYVAAYNYTASDTDEIGLQEGDIITNPTRIDEGWMEGRNQRTGKFGMFPANYVEQYM